MFFGGYERWMLRFWMLCKLDATVLNALIAPHPPSTLILLLGKRLDSSGPLSSGFPIVISEHREILAAFLADKGFFYPVRINIFILTREMSV